ncbi:methionyl-tRNA formyltransferase [Alphaproteobacteria bacterium]|nr:methionyl-tRNA formyltransferase [Alphaproteobacteria bacterium]
MTQKLRLIFMGSPDFSVPSLTQLAAHHDVVAVWTQPPRKSGRGMKLTPTPIAREAERLGIECFWPERLTDEAEQARIAAYNCDVAIVVAYGLILPQAVLDIPRFGCINGHASLLPRWRGAAPLQRALEAGDTMTGVTAMQMEKGLDTGPMLETLKIDIKPKMTSGMLHDKSSVMTADVLIMTLAKLTAGCLVPKPQPEEGVTYAAKISAEDAALDLQDSAVNCARIICAYSPVPGAWLTTAEGRLKLFSATAKPASGTIFPPTTYLGMDEDGNMRLSCGATSELLVSEVQPAGKQKMPAQDFINGYRLQVGRSILG